MRINYRLGALLAGIGWAFAFAAVQLVAFFSSAFTITLGALLFLPFGIFFSFLLRRFALKVFCKPKSEK